MVKTKNSCGENVRRGPIRWIKDCWYDFTVLVHGKFHKNNNKPAPISKRRRKDKIFFSLLVLYPMLQFFVFYVLVNINSIFLAFKEFDINTATFHWRVDNLFGNFADFIRDAKYDSTMVSAIWNSVKLYLSSLIIALPLNLIFSFFLYKKVWGAGFFRVILFLPQIISALVVSLMFRYFVENGLSQLIGINLLQSKATGFSTMIFYSIWASFGTQILIYTSAMSKIDESLVEFGKLEGISLFREMMTITLPLIYPTITIFLVTGIAGLFVNQASLFNFYGGSARADMQTLGYIFFVRIIKSNDAAYTQYPYASAAGLLFTLIATPITLLAKYLLERFGPSAD